MCVYGLGFATLVSLYQGKSSCITAYIICILKLKDKESSLGKQQRKNPAAKLACCSRCLLRLLSVFVFCHQNICGIS
jgi:hypothetical protein